MAKIEVLDQRTVDQIAAGEVIERPASVVKELVENAIDAGASALTVEIREGGTSFIRVTDNGSGIEASEVRTAFLPHATSKIRTAEDLFHVASLGFRGEALPSIASIAMVEVITKTAGAEAGVRYCIDGGTERILEEIAAPQGTTFLVRSLFYNTPARRKFLKSATTETGYVSDLMEHLALSHPEISFQFIVNGQTRLSTSGNHELRDVIYQIYGREIAASLAEVKAEQGAVKLTGYIGKPVISRGNRAYETYFINGRYIRSQVIARGIEEGYRTFMMQHRYPFTVLHFTIDGDLLDVNVHPTKMELRFANQEEIFRFVRETIKETLTERELIPEVKFDEPGKESKQRAEQNAGQKSENKGGQKDGPFAEQRIERPAEQYDQKRTGQSTEQSTEQQERNLAYFMEQMKKRVTADLGETKASDLPKAAQNITFHQEQMSSGQNAPRNDQSFLPKAEIASPQRTAIDSESLQKTEVSEPVGKSLPQDQAPTASEEHWEALLRESANYGKTAAQTTEQPMPQPVGEPEQLDLFERRLLNPKTKSDIRIIGQLFDTYWLVQFEDKFYMIDQHAAHEKVLYERTVRTLESKEVTSQLVSPPLILTLSMQQEARLREYQGYFTELGFEIEPFGGHEYAISAIPANLFGLAEKELFLELLDSLDYVNGKNTELVLDRIATMSCKAAVKGNMRLSAAEARALIEELLTLDNPYNCPHGRPTIIAMTRQEIEKKFKRIV